VIHFTVELSVISNACNFAVVNTLPVTMETYGCDWVQQLIYNRVCRTLLKMVFELSSAVAIMSYTGQL